MICTYMTSNKLKNLIICKPKKRLKIVLFTIKSFVRTHLEKYGNTLTMNDLEDHSYTTRFLILVILKNITIYREVFRFV